MAKTYGELYEEAMQLPAKARLLLGHEIISSVVYEDLPPGPSDEEIERRIREYQAGKGKSTDAYEALDRIRKKLGFDADPASR